MSVRMDAGDGPRAAQARSPLAGSWAIILIPAFVLLALAAQGRAADTYWQAGMDDWFDPTNWTEGVPTPADSAYIDNGGTAVIAAGSAEADRLRAGYAGSGTVVQTGGAVTVGHFLGIYDQGTYILDGGTLSAGNIGMGYSDGGRFAMSDGTLSVAGLVSVFGDFVQTGGSMSVADFVEVYGTFMQAGGSMSVTEYLHVIGTFIQTGGSTRIMNVPPLPGHDRVALEMEGSYAIGRGTLTVDGDVVLGRWPIDSTPAFIQTGGMVAVAGDVSLGTQWGRGSYTLHDGVLSIDGILRLGVLSSNPLSTGTFLQTGGTVEVGSVRVGAPSGQAGRYTLAGGSLRVGDLRIDGGLTSEVQQVVQRGETWR